MLKIKTNVENGFATITMYNGEKCLGQLYRAFSTNHEAYQWLALRGVDSPDNISTFVHYLQTKGSIFTRVFRLLSEESYFILNRSVGEFKISFSSTGTPIMTCQQYRSR